MLLSRSELSDADLVLQVREGDHAAYGELWHRHADAGRAAARRVTQRFDPDDLVQEAFARILETLDAGRGPDGAFRPYLYTTIRNIAATWGARVSTVPLDDSEVDEPVTHTDQAAALAEGSLLGRAYASLPPEWAEVLWYTELEELTPAEVAPLLGLQANSVAALSYRAREGLRRAWLQAHVTRLPDRPECRWVAEHVGDFHRGALSTRAQLRFTDHVAECVDCPVLVAEVGDEAAILVRSRLRALLWPALLGAMAFLPNPLDSTQTDSTPTGSIPAEPVAGPARTARVGGRRPVRRPSRHQLALASVAAATAVGVMVSAFGLGIGGLGSESAAAARSAAPHAESSPTAETPQPAVDRLDSGDPRDLVNPVRTARLVDDLVDGITVGPAARSVAVIAAPTTTSTVASGDLTTLTATESAAPTAPTEPTEPVDTTEPTDPVEPTDPTGPAEPTETAAPTAPVVLDVLADPHYLPALSGTAEPGAEIVVSTTDGTVAGRTTADLDGSWRVATDTPLTAGEALTLTVAQTVDGVTSPASEPLGPFTMIAPTVVSPADGGIATLTALDGDGVADDVAVQFEGTAGLLVEAAVDGVVTGRVHTLEETPLTRAVRAVSVGTHTFAVRYTDTSRGLVGVWTTITFEAVAP